MRVQPGSVFHARLSARLTCRLGHIFSVSEGQRTGEIGVAHSRSGRFPEPHSPESGKSAELAAEASLFNGKRLRAICKQHIQQHWIYLLPLL